MSDKYLVRQTETHIVTYEVTGARDAADAVVKVINREEGIERVTTEFLCVDEEHGMSINEWSSDELNEIQARTNSHFSSSHMDSIYGVTKEGQSHDD